MRLKHTRMKCALHLTEMLFCFPMKPSVFFNLKACPHFKRMNMPRPHNLCWLGLSSLCWPLFTGFSKKAPPPYASELHWSQPAVRPLTSAPFAP
jgi:hypothetical protein